MQQFVRFTHALVTVLLVTLSVSTHAQIATKKGISTPKPLTKTYTVNGISAWSVAKTNGFKFFPNGDHGLQDGSGARGMARCYNPGLRKWQRHSNKSHMVGGVNMILYPPTVGSFDCKAVFNFFSGKKLHPAWKIKSMRFTGSYSFNSRKWQPNSQTIETQIQLSRSKMQSGNTTAMLKEIVLEGPVNQSWEQAFTGQ